MGEAFRRDDLLDCNGRLGGGARFGVKRAIYDRNAISRIDGTWVVSAAVVERWTGGCTRASVVEPEAWEEATRGRVLRGAMLAAASMFGSAAVVQEAPPTIEVVGVSPVAGSEIDNDKVPAELKL